MPAEVSQLFSIQVSNVYTMIHFYVKTTPKN